MFGRRITLFRILGFDIRIDLSWLGLAMLITWSLAASLFPAVYEGHGPALYWTMGFAGLTGFIVSITSHELFHSLVARKFGMPMNGITLFIFGGVAEMPGEPSSPKAEFLMAIAGPLSSAALGALFYAAATAASQIFEPAAVVLAYLAVINWVLAGFNLLPAFPLDGGRVLRSMLWHRMRNLQRATRIASWIGSGFGIVLIIAGMVNTIRGSFISGIWQCMIGLFLRHAAEMSYRQLLIKRSPDGVTLAQVMTRNPVVVPPAITLRSLVEEYVLQYHFKLFPVMENDRLLGAVTVARLKEFPRTEWDLRTVTDALDTCSPRNAINPGENILAALSRMQSDKTGSLMVIDGDRLLGIVSRRDIMDYLTVRTDVDKVSR